MNANYNVLHPCIFGTIELYRLVNASFRDRSWASCRTLVALEDVASRRVRYSRGHSAVCQ